MKIKKIGLFFASIICSSCMLIGCSTSNESTSDNNEKVTVRNVEIERDDSFDLIEHNRVSFSKLGYPRIADAYSTYENGVINYANTGSTLGYDLNDNDLVLDFVANFSYFQGTAFLSFNFRASDFGRTHGTNIENLGYVFLIYPSGSISLSKNRTAIGTFLTNPFETNTDYDIQIGAVDVEGGTVVVLYINGLEVIHFYDYDEPLTEGSWVIICGDSAPDAGVTATLSSKPDSDIPSYPTYTYSTLRECMHMAGTSYAKNDLSNNIEITSGGQTVGFNHNLKSFAISGIYTPTLIASGSSFFINLRANAMIRSSGINQGYAIMILQNEIRIYKRTADYNFVLMASRAYSFKVDKSFFMEFGVVDISKDTTNIFIKINDDFSLQTSDNDNPWQQSGWIAMNPEGNFLLKISSEIRNLKPLQYQIKNNKNDKEFKLFFNTALSHEDLTYEDLDKRILDSICLDGYTVYGFNKKYHTLDENGKWVKPVNIYTHANSLVINVAKKFYLPDGIRTIFDYNKIRLLRTNGNSGFISEYGHKLTSSYVMVNRGSYKFGADEMYQQIWNDNVIYNEPCVITEHDDESFYAELMYTPTDIIAVKDYTTKKDYLENEYRVEGKRIYLTSESTMPYFTKDNMSCKDIPESIGGTYPDGYGGNILFTEGTGIISHQIWVTYEHEDSWTGTIPAKAGKDLPRLQEKLNNKEDIKLHVFGDSIFTGASASGRLGVSPFVPIFPIGFKNEIQRKYGVKVTLTNTSLGGKTSSWGAEEVAERVLPYDPDLLVIGFGMNDGSGDIPAQDYLNNIKKIVDETRKVSPQADVVVCLSIIANWNTIYNRGQAKYVQPIKDYAAQTDNLIVLDMTTFSQDVSKYKNTYEMFVNDINHPCDYMVRQYVANFMQLIDANY